MTETLTFTAPDSSGFDVYIARPEGEPIGGLVLVHEVWGLVDHIRRVADRYAAEGWLVAAPDILSVQGTTPDIGEELQRIMASPDEAERIAAQPRIREAFSVIKAPDFAAWAVDALRTVVDWLAAQPGTAGRLAVTGFCFGGTYAFALAAADDRIRAAVPFYGSAPSPDDIASIHAPILAIYGAHDPGLMDALPDVTAAMASAGVDFEAVVYPDAAHAFFNDTGSRYRKDHADDAWRRATSFLRAHVVR